MTIVAQQQSRQTGQWVRAHRLRDDQYVVELLGTDGTWLEVPSCSASSRTDAVVQMRRLARGITDLDPDDGEVVGFVLARPASH